MKTIKLVLAATLLAGLTSLSFAGPGPQFWDQQTKNAQARIAAEAKAGVPTKVEAAIPVAACATCSCCVKKA